MSTATETSQQSAPGWLAMAPVVFVLLWATGFVAARYTAPHAEPLSLLAYRFAIVAALLALWSVIVRAPWPGPRDALAAFIVGAVIHTCYLGSVFWAVYHGMPAGVSALIVGLQPLLTAFIAAPMLGERIGWRHWLGLLVGIAGVALVVWPKLTFTATGITPLTLAVSVFGTVCFAGGSIYQKKLSSRFDLRTGNVYQFLGAAALAALVAALTEEFAVTWNGQVIFAMFWLVAVLSIGAISLLYLMIRHGEVSKVSGLFYLVPAVTAVMAWLWFDEMLLPVQMMGMALCAAAVVLVMRRVG